MERKIIPVSQEDALKGMRSIKEKIHRADEADLVDGLISRVKKGTKKPEIGLETTKNVLDQQKHRKKK